MNDNPYKIIYAAVSSEYNLVNATKAVTELTQQENIETFVISKNLINAGQTEYTSENQEQSVSNQMSLIRRMDEVWLIGTDNTPFKLELRVIKHDGKIFRQLVLDGNQLKERI